MRGKLIIIESGSDASGKATQTKKLYERLKKEGYMIKKVEYPNYESQSSALVKMYLRGDFGKNASDVDPYIASTFFTADRYASFKTDWEEFYNKGGIIIADRYTTSNMVHQASKMDIGDREKYLNWLADYEFNLFKIPQPDCVVFLDVPIEFSEKLMENRKNKITGEKEKDIHESDIEYLEKSYNNALYIADKYDWKKINCVSDNKLRSIESIHNEVYEIVLDSIKSMER
ncbi:MULTISPECIES: dTMP kinase [unclassified Clostridioides]|uniref:dTMP kinase n=1 Tax=unclassified Clostridioides TaxID=2635829 RepID=UPI001D11A215|nr:deoxynucleoside kinase [Clostridioides sp. ZZV14-6150]MCC0661752.1 deoxynucleoside kinase [Clostridioides sp. ZZV14-6154]MCC0669557.1 deoxynucleoside kinase [Clostridioides sp. ZZV14-6153]MCC0719290.1 deoxynucleoside kinase [Clostridioides sp. ZZV14-6105]MCC0723539.1 deoxynucleoside kinase [Clostridioides sp. ZZV14-6104]MCC0727381.1 deoxynucleoside kinase [Clostridioides sp. ZZV14-6045]MCC0731446.1 deoxynucleoside kinase [Clostridioides sp. ZZV14-6048]MCC0735763.1 deoxynucleoside kinase [